jgi:lipopolysaccharide transport system permease protein
VLWLLLSYFDISLTATAFWTVPILVLLAGLATAVSLVLCAVHVRFRDVGVAMPLLLQFWMFASPVLYPLSAVPSEWRRWYILNPAAGIVDGFRRAVLDGATPDLAALGVSTAFVALALPLAYLWFKHVEATMADVI